MSENNTIQGTEAVKFAERAQMGYSSPNFVGNVALQAAIDYSNRDPISAANIDRAIYAAFK